MGSGLQERYSQLIVRAATAGDKANAGDRQDGRPSGQPIPSVREFVEQYRFSYDEAKKAGYRMRAQKAYEEIFNVADRTNDMADAQIILEKERLLWNVVTADAQDIYETILEAMDPLNQQLTKPLAMLVDVYRTAESEEELLYRLDLYEYMKIAEMQRGYSKIFMTSLFAYRFMQYDLQRHIIWQWPDDALVKSAIRAMIALRNAIRRQEEILSTQFDMTFEDLLAEEGMKIWLLVPESADALGRIKTALHPQNYKALCEILEDEIRCDKTVETILLSEPRNLVYYALDKTAAGFLEYAQDKAAQLNESIAYFKYSKQLDSASGGLVQSAQPKNIFKRDTTANNADGNCRRQMPKLAHELHHANR
jgi:hypothetical protein